MLPNLVGHCMSRNEGCALRLSVSKPAPLMEPSPQKAHTTRRTRRLSRASSQGFTLIELLITMAVILTLAALAVPNLMSAWNQARTAKAIGDINTIEDEIAAYQNLNNGALPDDLSQIGYGNYLDPWGNPYQYLNHSTMKGNGQARKDRFLVPLNADYDLYSMGPDGKSSPPITASPSQDDIIRAANGSYVGPAADF